MQGKLQNHIQQLMKDHKRRRIWKRVTAMMSVIVLLGTLVSLRNFAIAVTEEKAQEAQITEAVQAALAETASVRESDGVAVTPSFTPDEVGATDEAVNATPEANETTTVTEADEVTAGLSPLSPLSGDRGTVPSVTGVEAPETVSTNGTDTSSVGFADSFPSRGSSEAPEAVTTAAEAENSNLLLEGRSTSGGRWSSADRSGAETVAPQATEEVSTQAAPETVLADGTDTSSVGSADSFPSRGSSEALTTVTITDDPVALAPTATEIEMTTETATDSLTIEGAQTNATLNTRMLRAAPMATLLGQEATGNNISSAAPVAIYVYDAFGNPASNVYMSDSLIVEIGWRVNDASQIKNAGDFVTVTLPSEMNFSNGEGNYDLDEAVTGASGRTWPVGTSLVDYTISNNVLTFVFTQAAADLNAAGKLTRPVTGNAFQWTAVKFANVNFNRTGTYTPAVTINGQSVSNRFGAINVLEDTADRLTDVQITEYKINGYNNGQISYNNYVKVGREDPVTIDLSWSWKSATQYLSDGDFYEIKLPEGLSYNHLSDRSYDERGNLINLEITNDNGTWKLRVTYEKVISGRYNESSGSVRTTGYLLNPVSGNMALTASVVNGSASRIGYITVDASTGSVTPLPAGQWTLRRGMHSSGKNNTSVDFGAGAWGTVTGDVATDFERVIRAQSNNHIAVLWVIAASSQTTLSPEPFSNVGRVDFDPKTANYLDAYCANASQSHPQYGSSGGNFTKYDIDSAPGLTAAQKTQYKNMMSTAYPYVSLKEMETNLGMSGYNITANEAVTAVQAAVWSIRHGSASVVADTFDGMRPNVAKTLMQRLLSYQPGTAAATGSLSFTAGPDISFNGTTVTVTGTLSAASGVTGTLRNTTKNRTVNVTINGNGSFTATMTNVARTDHFTLDFNGTGSGTAQVWYFQNTTGSRQDVIAAQVGTTPVKLHWEYQGQEETTREVRIVKQWKDKNGNIITGWPAGKTLEVTLYRRVKGGTIEKVPVTAPQTNPVTLSSTGQAYSWTNLPLTDGNGNVYTYTVVETKVPDGYEYVGMIPTGNGSQLIFTATNEEQEEEKTLVKVIKKWEGVSDEGMKNLTARIELHRKNADGTTTIMHIRNAVRTENASGIYLKGDYSTTNGNEVRETLTAANNWTIVFDGLPKYESDGTTLIEYIVKEVGVTDDFTVEITQPDMSQLVPTATVTNTLNTTEVRIIKDWKGVPDSLKKNYKAVVGLFFQIDNGLNGGIGFKNNVMIKDRKDTVTASGLEITGSYKLDTTSYPPIERDGFRYAIVELTADNNWTATFKNLPKYGTDGKPVQYMMRELRVEDEAGQDVTEDFAIGYDSSAPGYTYGDGNYYVYFNNAEELPTVTVTNTKNGSLTVIKKWVNADGLTDWSEVLPGGLLVELSARRNGQEVPAALLEQLLGAPTTVELNAGNGWSHTWDYVYTTNIEYFVREVGFVNGHADRYVRIDENGTAIPYDDPIQVEYDKDQKIFKICLVNKRKPVEVELIKEDKLNPDKKLEGATFKLFDWNGNQVLNPAEKDGLFKTDANGSVKIGDPNGLHLMISQKKQGLIYKYVLVEQDPPTGYIKRQNPLTVTFHVEISNGNPMLMVDKVDDASAAAGLVSAEGSLLKLHIRNERAEFTLPETGGIGTRGYTTGGLMLICMAALLYIVTNQHITKQFHTNRFVKK